MPPMESRVTQLEITMATIETDLGYIKDNVDAILNKMDDIHPAVVDNTYWVSKVKQAIYWIAISGVVGGILTTAFYIIKNKYLS